MAHRWRTANPDSPAARRRAAEYASPRHKAQRVADKRLVDSGHAACWRCHKPIPPGSRWHTGHSDDRTRYMGPEHATCNLTAAARAGNKAQRARRQPRAQSRQW